MENINSGDMDRLMTAIRYFKRYNYGHIAIRFMLMVSSVIS